MNMHEIIFISSLVFHATHYVCFCCLPACLHLHTLKIKLCNRTIKKRPDFPMRKPDFLGSVVASLQKKAMK